MSTPASKFEIFNRQSPSIEPEYQSAYDTWAKDRSPAATWQLLGTVQPVLDAAAKQYAPLSNNALSEARLLAADALKSYDPAKGPLRPHLMSQLQGLRRIAAKQQQIISVPERAALARNQMQQMSQELEVELGRMPTLREISQRTGMSRKRLIQLQRAGSVAEGQIRDPESGEVYEADATPIGAGDPAQEAYIDMVLEDLDPTDRAIADWRLGRDGEPVPVSEIARRLGRTPGAISQRLARIQKLLDEEPLYNPFRSQ